MVQNEFNDDLYNEAFFFYFFLICNILFFNHFKLFYLFNTSYFIV